MKFSYKLKSLSKPLFVPLSSGIQESLCKESKHADPQMQVQLNKLERLENEYLKLTSTQSVAEVHTYI